MASPFDVLDSTPAGRENHAIQFDRLLRTTDPDKVPGVYIKKIFLPFSDIILDRYYVDFASLTSLECSGWLYDVSGRHKGPLSDMMNWKKKIMSEGIVYITSMITEDPDILESTRETQGIQCSGNKMQIFQR